MIAAVALSFAILGGTQKSSVLIGQVIERYHDAQTLVGTIRQTTTATYAGQSVTQHVLTNLQFERPSKLYLKQDLEARPNHPAQTWLVTSDGTRFSYGLPNGELVRDTKGSTRLVELVRQTDRGELYDVAKIYAVASQSLGDRSDPLGVVMGWTEELRRITATYATLEAPEAGQLNGVDGYKISGKYRESPQRPATGKFEMFVSKQGDLLQYSISELEGAKSNGNIAVAEVTTTWDLNLQINGTPDPKLFTLVVK